MSKVWLLTGCSSGFGKIFAEKLIANNQKVIVTARNIENLRSLSQTRPSNALFLTLDVTNQSHIETVVAQAIDRFGRIDVLVNNAGYGLLGALEECSPESIQRQFDTNVFGLMHITQAVLPFMRKQKSGYIMNLSSTAGLTGTAGFGMYNASKFAVEGLSEALALEVAHLGIKVTLIEPGPFRTDFAGRSGEITASMADYAPSVGISRQYIADINGKQPGDPEKAVDAMIELANDPSPPLRVLLGSIALGRLDQKIEQLVKTRKETESIARSCDYT